MKPWQPFGPLLKVQLLVGPTGKIPRSTLRGVQGIRRSTKMCQVTAFERLLEISSPFLTISQ